jgi:hypothetical protein
MFRYIAGAVFIIIGADMAINLHTGQVGSLFTFGRYVSSQMRHGSLPFSMLSPGINAALCPVR